MDEQKPLGDIWAQPDPLDVQPNQQESEQFVEAVVERVHQKILIRDILMLVFAGFFGVMMGMIKMKNRSEVGQ